jgi:hypothetical protein
VIRTVGLFTKPLDIVKLATTSIRIGNDANPNNNAVCLDGIDKDGIYACGTALTGNFLGIKKTGATGYYGIREIWAYSWVPFDETNSTLSADVMPNGTLNNAVKLVSSSTVNIGLIANTLF